MYALPNPNYEALPRYQKHLKNVDDEVRRHAITTFLASLRAHYHRHLSSPRVDYDVRISDGDTLLRRLQDEGCAFAQIDALRKARLVELVEPFAKTLHQRLDELPAPRFKDSQQQFDPVEHADIFRAADKILQEEQIYAVGSAYAGSEIAIKTLAVQVNTERATAFTYGSIDERGLPQPKTRYMHIDSALWPPLKVLIYINQVTKDQGPFRYVVGSHRIATEFELMVRKTNDKTGIHNEQFMALPPQFRMYTEFGDALEPHNEGAAALLQKEVAYCDGTSDFVMFDFNGVHRGGFVRQGHRYILQCCFEARDQSGVGGW